MKNSIFYFLILVNISNVIFAQNPIIQTMYTADPAPMVYNGKLYLYTSHDENESTWFVMNNWKLYTTTDMVNWTDHGVALSYKDFDWAQKNAWAPQCVERNGKFYMYVPVTDRNNKEGIAVAVSYSPYGPFIDPLGKHLVQSSGWGDIDPAVMVDDDGQAYLYWGNPACFYVKLNEDMISYSGEIMEVPMIEESFGKREGNVKNRPTLYEEGPWLYKRKDLYYLLWAGGPVPEHIGYSTGKNPEGPWEYRGTIMPPEGKSFTNHPGIVDYKGDTYFFYHNGSLPGGGGFTRSVCVGRIEFNKDGTIKPMRMTDDIGKGLETLNPYQKNEAETIAFSEGVKATQNKEVGVFINAMENGAYTKVRDVDFRTHGASKFTARTGTTHNAGITMEVRIDSKNGPLLGMLNVPLTGGDNRWAIQTIDIEKAIGVHDLYFIFKGEKPGRIMYFDYWMFSK
ncbi:MAG: glycoside hydrolase family 43 protein [Tannerella sp.]|jgi:beta-xylosidase|nr:glycoside hydrolase family 43 protein [Tannerella sp.]